MRLLIIIIFSVFCGVSALPQKNSIAYCDSVSNSLYDKNEWQKLIKFGSIAKHKIDYYDLDIRLQQAYFYRNIFSGAEKYSRKAFTIYETKEAAQGIYYSLLYSGLDIEAKQFNNKYNSITEIKNVTKKGASCLLFNIGDRLSSNQNSAGDMFYADICRISKPKDNTNLMQDLIYSQQYNPTGDFKQIEYFNSIQQFIKNGWYIKPSFHYALTLYNNSSVDSIPYSDSVSKPLPFPAIGLSTVKTFGKQNDINSIPGILHSLNIAFGIEKRMGAITIGIEPAFQISYNANQINTKYSIKAKSDSFINGNKILTYPYFQNAVYSISTTTVGNIVQLGGTLSYIFPIKGSPLYSKFSAFYLIDNNSNSASAFNFYTLLKVKSKVWFHFSYTSKGNLPWANNNDGQYFNTFVALNYRYSLTLQFKPLKKFSPMLTFQNEKDGGGQSKNSVIYNSFYLTLKYNL